ncbi:hypothetical protein [Nocardia crassostreae]|uniref:hypothetical protein n=1 Tax=Nocardia crassostreae TaxID=53428 RepID=UPI0012FC48F8|nr:hypothetical protein [Nocardia crassostreae]
MTAHYGAGSAAAGIITAAPVVAFALISLATPLALARISLRAGLFVALSLIAVSLAVRPWGDLAVFIATTFTLALGVGLLSVLLPAVIRTTTSTRTLVTTFTTALQVGAALGFAAIVPVSHAVGGWQRALAVWAALAPIGALALWRSTLGSTTTAVAPTATSSTAAEAIPPMSTAASVGVAPMVASIPGAASRRTPPLGVSSRRTATASDASERAVSERTVRAGPTPAGRAPTGAVAPVAAADSAVRDDLASAGFGSVGAAPDRTASPVKASERAASDSGALDGVGHTRVVPARTASEEEVGPAGGAPVRSGGGTSVHPKLGGRVLAGGVGAVENPIGVLRRTGTVGLAVFFGLQAMVAFVVIGWLPSVLTDAGVSEGAAGGYLGLLTCLAVPISLVVPPIVAGSRHPERWLAGFSVCSVLGILGFLVAPGAAPLVWSLVLGVGLSVFSLALTVITVRAPTPEQAIGLSSAVQGVGYVIAAVGPYAIGVFRQFDSGWGIPLGALLAAAVVQTIVGYRVGGGKTADPGNASIKERQ